MRTKHDELDRVERELGRAETPAPPQRTAHPQWAPTNVLALQRAGAGNHAISRVLQRKLKVLPAKTWINKSSAMPEIPPRYIKQYQPYAIEQASALVRTWRDDGEEEGREFTSLEALWSAAFRSVVTEGKADPPQQTGDAWSRIAFAVKQSGNVTELPWASLEPKTARKLLAELQVCEVQNSSNAKASPFHGNAHGKLPKKVNVPDGKELSQLPAEQQIKLSPYVEILVPGHKSDRSEVERGIIDVFSKQVYLTAHYDKGSFVWLSGAPEGLVNAWYSQGLNARRAVR